MTEVTPLFDRALYLRRLTRARETGPDVLNTTITSELLDRTALITRSFRDALVIAPQPVPVAEALLASGFVKQADTRLPPPSDNLELGQDRYDAIFHILDLHAVNDVPGVLTQLRQALRPDGLLLACLFAGESLTELRQSFLAAESQLNQGATPRVAPMISVRELGGLLQRAGFALPVADMDRTIVRYADAIGLVHEISALGMSNMVLGRSRIPVSRRLLGAAAQHYHENFADDDGRIRTTLELAWLTAWSPHESQPKPLKPGSARISLTEVLKPKS
jgi:SAM-dependent methyltransferase